MTKADIVKQIHEPAAMPEGQALDLLEWIIQLLKSPLKSVIERLVAVTRIERLPSRAQP